MKNAYYHTPALTKEFQKRLEKRHLLFIHAPEDGTDDIKTFFIFTMSL